MDNDEQKDKRENNNESRGNEIESKKKRGEQRQRKGDDECKYQRQSVDKNVMIQEDIEHQKEKRRKKEIPTVVEGI